MPLLLDDLKYNKLYNKQIFLPTNEDNRRKLASIVLLTPSYESSVRCMTYPRFINNRLYTSYYTEKDINFVINRESSSMTLERGVLQELDLVDNSLSKYNRVTIPVEDIGIRFPELNTPEGLRGTAYIFTDSSDRAYGYAVVNGNALTYLWSASSKIRMDLLDFVIDTVGATVIAAHLDHDLLLKAKKDYHFIPARGKYLVRNVFKELNESKRSYDPPMNEKEVRSSYGEDMYKNLIKDEAHKFRMQTGIELIHKEPTVDELNRIMSNWNLMSDDMKKQSEKKSMQLYGKTNKDHYDELVHLYESTVLTESASLIDAEIKIWQAQIKITEEIIKFFNNASWVKSKLGSMKSKLIKLPIDGYNNSLMTMDDFKNQLENQKVTLDFYMNMKALDLKDQYDLSDMVKEYTYWIKALKCPKTLKIKILKRTISSYKLTIKEYERALKDYEKMTVMNRRKENLKALVNKTFSIFGFLTGGPLGPLKSMAMKAIFPKSSKKDILSDDELKAKIALYTKIVEALEEELSETQALNESKLSSDEKNKRLSDIDKDAKELAKSCSNFLKSVQNKPEYKSKFKSEVVKLANRYKKELDGDDKYKNASVDKVAEEVFEIEYNIRPFSELEVDKYELDKGIVRVHLSIDCDGSQEACEIVGYIYSKDALNYIKKNNPEAFKNKYLKSTELNDDDGHWWIELTYDWSEELKFNPFGMFKKPTKESTLLEEKLSSKERNDLSDSEFGIPKERRYPLNDESHVKSAIQMFNHVDTKNEEILARNIKRKAKEYGIEISVSDANRLSKYIKENALESEILGNRESISFNIEAFTNGINNVCFITGGQATHKTTLGLKLHEDYGYELIMLDRISENSQYSVNELAEYNDGVITEFFLNNPTYRGENSRTDTTNAFLSFFTTYAKNNPHRIFIVEGIDIVDSNILAIDENSSIVVLNRPVIDCILSGMKRDIDGGFNRNMSIFELAVAYINRDKDITSFVEAAHNNLDYIKPITESTTVIPLNEDFVITENSIRSKEYMTMFESSLTEDAKYNNMIRKMIYPERIRNQKELLYQYDRIKEDCPFIKRTFLNYKKYMGYNLFIDMSYYMTNFIKHNYLKLDRGVNITIDFINRFLEDDRLDSLGYKKKTVFVPIHDWNVKENTFLWDYKNNINPISIIYRMIKRGNDFQLLKDSWGKTDFVFLGDTGYFKINLSKFSAKDLPRFMTNLKNLINHERVVDTDEPDHSPKGLVASIADKLELNSHNKIEINNLVGSAAGDTLTPEEIKDKISKSSSDVAEKDTTSKEEKRQKKEKEVVDGIKAIASKADSEDTIENELDNNEYLKQAIVDLQSMSPDAVDITPTRAARITELNNKFMENQIKGKRVAELIGDFQNDPLPEVALPVDSINDEWKHITYTSFNTVYNVDSDISKCIYHFGQCTVPVAVRDIKVEDTSTSEDSIETWTVQCEDAYGKRFTLKFDIPKIVDKRFMKLRGNKKTMSGQLMNLPIIKTDRDTCQITSNYNKIFVRRFNTSPGKSNAVAGRFIKTVLKLKESGSKNYDIKLGDTTLISNKYDLPMDYIDIGSKIAKVSWRDKDVNITLYFDQDEFLSKYKDKLDPKQGDFAFVVADYGHGKEDIIYPDSTYSTIAEFATAMLWKSDSEFVKVYETTSQSVKSTYAKASIMSTDIPVAVLLGYAIGLTAMLKRAAIEYTIEDKRPSYNKNSYDAIRLADCWIVYKNTYLASIILNGLKECDMAAYTLAETNTKKMWLEQLDLFGGRIKADGLDMFYDLMFDPITKEVCAKYKIPDNYCDALIYASHLLSDIKFNAHSDLSGNRFRNNEIIAGYTYKVLATSYSTYRRELKAGRQAMMSVKRSAVIDAILMDNTCSDLSILSPLLEVESANSVSFKGLSGMNTDRAYGLDKRIYSDSMRNVLAMSTGFSANVGINRQATIDMNIDTPRGYIKSSSVDDMSVTKSFCMTEALTPYGSVSDDTFRTAMTFIQTSKHEMRTEISDPLIVSNGADQAIAYMTSDTFSFKAKNSGVVKEKTDEYMVLEYKDGKTEVVDLREQMMKNSDGGMWIPVQLKTEYKEGYHFKAGEIVAVDPLSYSNNVGPSDNYSYNVGTLVKFAILATDAGYEDACVHTEYLSRALSSKIVDQKQYIFPKSTNVYEMVKKGQQIQEGDPLIIFQNAFEEEDANNLIRMLTNADENAVSELGRIPIRSKVTGVIDDIKIYRCVEIEELSPSLKKIVTDYEKEVKKYNKVLEKYDPEKAKVADATYKLEPTGKLKNCEGSIMIEFYISYLDNFSAADKVVNYSALKGVSSKQIPAGKEPRSKFRPDEKIHYQQSDIGDMKRMVGSIIKIGALNKVLIETGRKACDIMGVKWKYLDEY